MNQIASPLPTAVEAAAEAPGRPPSPLLQLIRALALRCPWCGQWGLFRSWFALRDACPHCAIPLAAREDGYFLGAMAVNWIAAELIVAALIVGVLVAAWPNPPWTFLQFGAPAAAGLMPVLFFPWSRTLWLALDWSSHPPSLATSGPGSPRPS